MIYYNNMWCCGQTKRPWNHGLFAVRLEEPVLGDAQSESFVTSCHKTTAGFAQHILGDSYTIASCALVGVYSMTRLSDTAYFSRQIFNTHFASFAFGKSFATAEGLENTESLGFGVDE
jgi:hypothetical protein